MEKIAELFAEFRIKFSDFAFKALNTTLSDLKLLTLGELFAIDRLASGLVDLGFEAVNTAAHFHMLETVYGLNAQALQRMEKSGLDFNVSMKASEETAVDLQNQLAAFSLGQGSGSFLQAAGFFGLNLKPGETEQDIFKQLEQKVPEFIKSHGPLGKAEAAHLLGMMGIPVEELQRLIGNRVTHQGNKMPNLTEQQIAAMTKMKVSLDVASTEMHYLGYTAIGNLIQVFGPIAEGIYKFLGSADVGIGKAAGWFNAGDYETQAEARAQAKGFLAHAAVKPWWANGQGGQSVNVTVKQTNHINGSVDPEKIKKALKGGADYHAQKIKTALARTAPGQ